MKTVFFKGTQLILFISAIGKLYGILQWDESANATGPLQDPLFSFFTVKQILFCAAMVELLVLFLIWRLNSDTHKAYSILWLSALFGTYRLALGALGYHGYCHCLGYWSTWANLSAIQVNLIAKVLLIFMFIGSALTVILGKLNRNPKAQ